MIEVSAQYGCQISSDTFWPMHRRLNEIFEARMRRDYGKKVNLLAIMLRVSGELQDFGSEGPERLFYRSKGKYLEIDLAIPRTAWEEKTLPQVRDYLVKGLKKTFATLKARLVKVDKEADLPSWESDFDSCLRQFEEEGGKHESQRKYTSVQARDAWRRRIRRLS